MQNREPSTTEKVKAAIGTERFNNTGNTAQTNAKVAAAAPATKGKK